MCTETELSLLLHEIDKQGESTMAEFQGMIPGLRC
jgi:hypothetical protein